MTKDEKNLEDTENQAYYFLANLSGGKFYLKNLFSNLFENFILFEIDFKIQI